MRKTVSSRLVDGGSTRVTPLCLGGERVPSCGTLWRSLTSLELRLYAAYR